MLIERDIARYTVASDETIEAALRQISRNGHRTVFCVEESGVVVGAITDGDFRRWLIANPGALLSTPASEVANPHFVSAAMSSGYHDIEPLLNEKVLLVPLVDDRGRLVAVARARGKSVWIGEHLVGEGSPAFVIAEIGINHNGSLDVAKRLVDAAAAAGATCAKFQLRDLCSLYRNAGAAGDPREDLGPQYTLDLLTRFSLGVDEMIAAFDYTAAAGLVPLCTPMDLPSARVLDDYGIAGFKIASADLTNHDLVAYVAQSGRPVVMSTGMSTEPEILESIEVLRSAGAAYVLLHCNSTYPAPFKDVNLRYMDRLAELGNCAVGYSGHERGFHVALAAAARGASVIEKHLTLDRTWEGNDHKVSLEPDEFGAMVHQLRELEAALGSSATRTVTQGELMNRVNLAKSVVARSAIRAGEEITAELLEVRGPGRGLQPNRIRELLGRRATRDFAPGDFFFPGDLVDSGVSARTFQFRRPFGLPVRYHDYAELAARSNPDFLEFHMSYRDLELSPETVMEEKQPYGLVVHSPELFPGDHLMDLAADDDAYRERSIRELQRVVDVARELTGWFKVEGPVLIVANLGGFTSDGPLPRRELPRRYARVAAALERIEEDGVEILPQTMPPFPWLMGGQLFHNLFVDPEDAASFAAEHGRRLCLDVAHTKLAANHRHISFFDAIEVLAPVAAHLHVVDAAGLDGEGVQVGEGEVDFRVLAEQLDRLAPGASFIPEIWQGHQNGGEGFWVALDRLERYL